MEECKLLLSGTDPLPHLCLWLFMKPTFVTISFFPFHCPGNVQQMDEEKKGLWKKLMERFSKSQEDVPEKAPEK